MVKRVLAAAAALLVCSAALAGTASAAPKGDPTQARPATPAHACAAIEGTLEYLTPLAKELFDIDLQWEFDFSDCVQQRTPRVPDVPGFGSPYDQCALLESEFLTYPFTFHEGEADVFPDLTAHNRAQCANALFTFHTIETILVDNGVPVGGPEE